MASKVSIIIPAYNAEKYLRECLESIRVQSYNNIEVLVIDDGSKDSTGKICDEYSNIDRRFFPIHQQNAGVSVARNNALTKATGEWVLFIDSDDWIEADYVQNYVKHIKDDIDLIYGGYVSFGGNRMGMDKVEFQEASYSKCTLSDSLPLLMTYCTPWGKMFRLSKIKEYGMCFDKRLSLSEDRLFLYEFISIMSGVTFMSYTGYHYRVIANSLMGRKHPIESLIYRTEALHKAAKAIKESWQLSLTQYIPLFKIHCGLVQGIFMEIYRNGKSREFYEENIGPFFRKDFIRTDFKSKLFVLRVLRLKKFIFSMGYYTLALIIAFVGDIKIK